MTSKTLLLVALVAAAGAPAAVSAQSTQRPAQGTAPARPAAPAAVPAAQAFTSMAQVCQFREREIAGLNAQILSRSQAAARETDPNRRTQIAAPLQQLRANLQGSEVSWQRMDCARVLYSRGN